MSKLRILCAALVVSFSLGGCTTMLQEFGFTGAKRGEGASSSLVDFLYPRGELPPDFDETIPALKLPLRVGLAFVPSNGRGVGTALTEEHRQRLLETTKERFVGYDYIDEIMIVPDTYMRRDGGFDNVEQVARLYSLDVMTLVSYDQVGWIEDNWKSITYWTIVGAYIFEGSEFDVSTFVDAAVFDVASRKLLFRAPGSSVMEGAARAIDHEGEYREAQAAGFDQAVAEMTDKLDAELARFRQRVDEGTADVVVTNEDGSTYTPGSASGSLGALELALLALACAGLWLAERRRRRVAS